MIVKIDRSLEKDVRKIEDNLLKQNLSEIINLIRNAKTRTEIRNLKKLKGSHNFYRIKLGDYRLGIIINGEEVEFVRLLHRKDIYKYFP